MTNASYEQNSFLGGEWAKVAQGGTDRKDYRTAMNVCLNSFPLEPGAWVRRPGFKRIAHSRAGAVCCLIRFAFKEKQPYNMEFTEGFLRFFTGTQPARSNDSNTITNVSTATPAVVTTATVHGWSTADYVQISGLGTIAPLLQNREFKITKLSTTTFSLADALTGAAIAGSTLAWTSGGTQVITRIYELATKFVAGDLTSLRSVQAETRALLLSGRIIPQLLTTTALPSGSSFATFSLIDSEFVDGPYLDQVQQAIANPSATPIPYTAWSSATTYAKGDLVLYDGNNYISNVNSNTNKIPSADTTTLLADTNTLNVAEAAAHANAIYLAGGTFGSAEVIRTAVTDIVFQLHRSTPHPTLAFADTTDVKNAIESILSDATVIANTPAHNKALDVQAANNALRADLTDAFWSLLPTTVLLNTNQYPVWNDTSKFAVGQIVLVGSPADLYISFAGLNQANNPLDFPALWGKVKPAALAGFIKIGIGFQDWDATRIYRLGEKVTASDANDYQSLVANNLNNKPPTSATQWLVLAPGTAVQPAGKFASGDVGRHIRLLSEPPNYDTTVTYAVNDVVKFNGTYWKCILADTIALDPNTAIANWALDPTGAIWTWGKIVSVVSFSVVTVQLFGSPLLYNSEISSWRLGVYADSQGWPKCGVYHDGRIWFSGVVPNRVDASMSNGFTDDGQLLFSPSAPDGTVADNNGISATFNAKDVNPIFWMTSEFAGIVAGTQAGEWLLQATQLNQTMTPTNLQARRMTKNGCANIEPCHAGLTLVFVQKFKRKLLEYFADVYSGKFTSPNLSRDAKHITVSGVAELAYQHELSPTIWSRLGDGTLAGCTYKRESLFSSQGPSFMGWHRHTLGSGRTIESICVGPAVDGLLDSVMISNNDPATNFRRIEVMTKAFEEGDSKLTAWFLDSAVAASSYTVGSTSVTFNGLWHLNGKTVSVFAGALDLGDFAVANGSITVPFSGSFTAAFVSAFSGAMPTVIGHTYTSDGQIVRPATKEESGARQGPAFGKVRRSHQMVMLLDHTGAGIKFGTTFDRLKTVSLASPGGIALAATELYSGTVRDIPDDSYTFDSMLCWRITRPYPATVVKVGALLATQDA